MTLDREWRTQISLEVRESSQPAQILFRKLNFKATRVIRGFYADTGEDAYLMEFRLYANAHEEDAYEPVNRIVLHKNSSDQEIP